MIYVSRLTASRRRLRIGSVVASGLPLNEMRYHGSKHECELALTTTREISSIYASG